MTPKHILIAAAAALLLTLPASAQSASDLLQKGIHAQEASGDLDGAIAIFRQVVESPSTNKPLAAQAQYQLVLCMLQKGDRAAATRELAALERNFAGMPDLVAKARKLIPGSSTLLPAPWGERECAQLDIKRAGVATGEYLYYSADAWIHTVGSFDRRMANDASSTWGGPLLQAVVFQWELKTTNSTRSIATRQDPVTMRPFENERHGRGISFKSDDDLGDPLAVPFSGPATDLEQSVFLMRRLPLAVGYKTTLPVTSNSYAPAQLELAVAGIETVTTPAGKFNCYKVSFAAIGQNFWIAVEGARPLVKFQSGTVEAELVKTWEAKKRIALVDVSGHTVETEVFESWGRQDPVMESLASTAKAAGAEFDIPKAGSGKSTSTRIALPLKGASFRTGPTSWENSLPLDVTSTNIHTPPAGIGQALQQALAQKTGERHLNPLNDYVVRPGSLKPRLIGGQQALSCLLDYKQGPLTAADTTKLEPRTLFIVWIASENALVELRADMYSENVATFRWRFDPIIDAIRIP